MEKVLNEQIKIDILKHLKRGNLKYSEILKKTNISDSGKLNYHLKLLISAELITKEEQDYKLTKLGERLGMYFNQFEFKEFYPVPAVILASIKDDEILLAKWNNKPIKNFWVLPGDKQNIGETIEECTLRLCKKELGVPGKFKKIFGIYPSIVRDGDEISYHAYLIVVLVDIIDESKETFFVPTDKHISELKYFKFDEINFNKIGPSNRNILWDLNSRKKFIFKEQDI